MTNLTSSGISLRELGRQLGVSHSAISTAVKTGRIPASMVGEKLLASGRSVPTIADPAAARVAFERNADPVRRIAAGKRAPTVDQVFQELTDESLGELVADLAGERPPPISESRAIREDYKARLMRMEYEQRSGMLVDAAEVKEKFAALIVATRTRLLGVPTKAKGRMPHLSIDDIAVLTALIREALTDLADGRTEPMDPSAEGNPHDQ